MDHVFVANAAVHEHATNQNVAVVSDHSIMDANTGDGSMHTGVIRECGEKGKHCDPASSKDPIYCPRCNAHFCANHIQTRQTWNKCPSCHEDVCEEMWKGNTCFQCWAQSHFGHVRYLLANALQNELLCNQSPPNHPQCTPSLLQGEQDGITDQVGTTQNDTSTATPLMDTDSCSEQKSTDLFHNRTCSVPSSVPAQGTPISVAPRRLREVIPICSTTTINNSTFAK